MTRDDVIKIMSVLRGAYPHFYRDISKQEAYDTINLWADMFSQDDASIVAAAVKSLIEGDDKGFPPTIGQVKAKMRLLVGNKELTEAEAWGLVSNAVKNGLYGASEEFEKLPPAVKRIVGSPSQLRDWASMDSETLNSVVASNFQRSYKVVATREREIAALPADVKKLISFAMGKEPQALPPAYESHEDTLKRLEDSRKKEWEAREAQEPKKRTREEVIAALLQK